MTPARRRLANILAGAWALVVGWGLWRYRFAPTWVLAAIAMCLFITIAVVVVGYRVGRQRGGR